VGLAVLLVVLGYVAWFVRVIWPPVILAGAIVFLLNPMVTWLQGRRIPRAAGAGITYLGFFALVALVGFLVAPLARDQADEFADEWPEVRSSVERWIDDRAAESQDWVITLPTVQEIEDAFSSDDESLADRLSTVRSIGFQVFHIVLIFVLAPIIAFYLLVDVPHLSRVAESLIPERARPEVMVIAQRLNRAIGGFFRGQLLVAFIVGVMVSVGLAIIDLPFWLIVGMIAGLFNMIPLIGPWVGAVPGIIIALTTRDVSTAVWVAVVMAGAQQIDNHFISPLVMQRTVKLHPAVVMMALLAGGTIGGFFGLLLAVPATAVVKIILGHVWRRYVLGQPLEDVLEQWQRDDSKAGVGPVEDVGDADVGDADVGDAEELDHGGPEEEAVARSGGPTLG
jgi:predicted PurR-regulated permease PerM